LSLLAIIYSLVSNEKMTSSIGSLSSITKDILSSSDKLAGVTNELDVKIESIPTSLKSMEDKTDKTHKLIEEIQNSKQQGNDSSAKPEIKTRLEPSEDITRVKSYLTLSSFLGKQLLYACSLSKNLKKGFTLKDLFEDSSDYVYGYLIASQSMGFIRFSETKEVFIVTEINETIDSEIEKLVYEVARAYDSDKKDDKFLEIHSWVKQADKIRSYFNENT
jgi:hypothetical protein